MKQKPRVLEREKLNWNKVALITELFDGTGISCLHSVFILALAIERMPAGGLLADAQEHLRQCKDDGRTEQYALDTLRAFIMKKHKIK